MPPLTIEVHHDLTADVAIVELTGTLDLATAPDLGRAVGRCLQDCPIAVMVDLRDVEVDHPLALTAIAAAGRQRRTLPEVSLIVCAPRALPPPVPVEPVALVATPAEGLAVASRVRAAMRPVTATLPYATEAPHQARDMVTEICQLWELTHILPQARLITSELVTNAVEHARSVSELEFLARGPFLHIRVGDSSPGPPRAQPAELVPVGALRGRGLMFVGLYSSGWGWLPTPTGKVVWASIRTRPIGQLDSP